MGRPKGPEQETYGVKHEKEIIRKAKQLNPKLHQIMKDKLYELSKTKDNNY